MHTHFGALMGFTAFLSVLLFGTLWRLSAARLAASSSPTAQNIGAAMAIQF
jgi:hypothetical protein